MNFTIEEQKQIVNALETIRAIASVKQLYVVIEFKDHSLVTCVHSNPFEMETPSGALYARTHQALNEVYENTGVHVVYPGK